MTRPIIHIGYQKTGSTFLQTHFFSRSDRGFNGPAQALSPAGGAIEQFVLAHPKYFDPAKSREYFEKYWCMEDSEDLIPVISHEDLSGDGIRSRYHEFIVANRIKKAFPDARILICVREQKSRIYSLYGQYVYLDGEWPINHFLGTGSEQQGFCPSCRLDHFEYHLLIEHYIDLFGADSVLVLPYEILRQNPATFIGLIYDYVENTFDAEYDDIAENVGIGAATVELRRRLNRFFKRQPLWDGNYENTPLFWRAKNRLCRYSARFAPESLNRRYENKLRDFIAERVSSYFNESNKITQRYIDFDLASLGYDI